MNINRQKGNFCQYLSCVWSVSFLRKQPLIHVAAVLSILSLRDRHIAIYVLVANQSKRKYHSEVSLQKKNCTSAHIITTSIFCLELFCRHRVDIFSIPARCSFSKQDRSNFLPVNSIEFRFFSQKDFHPLEYFRFLKSNKCAKFDALSTAFSSFPPENKSLELKLFS